MAEVIDLTESPPASPRALIAPGAAPSPASAPAPLSRAQSAPAPPSGPAQPMAVPPASAASMQAEPLQPAFYLNSLHNAPGGGDTLNLADLAHHSAGQPQYCLLSSMAFSAWDELLFRRPDGANTPSLGEHAQTSLFGGDIIGHKDRSVRSIRACFPWVVAVMSANEVRLSLSPLSPRRPTPKRMW